MQKYVIFVEKRILKKFANDKSYRKVRESCHFTVKYRGATQLKFKI